MAFAATASTKEPRSFSIGPYKIQFLTYTAASGDVAGTITADALTTAEFVIIPGLEQHTTAPVYSGNTVALVFTDPGATGTLGECIVIGK